MGLDELMAPLMKKSVKEEDTDGFARRAKVKVETAIVEHDKRPIKEESVNNEPVRDPGAAQDSAKRAKQSSGSGGFVPLPVEDSIAKPSTIEPNRPKIAFSFKKK